MVQAYCVKCRAKRDIKDPKEVKLKNGRPAVKGTCPTCGTIHNKKLAAVIDAKIITVIVIPFFDAIFYFYD